ncbi:MAG: hypothetical protein QOH95_622 [Gaiellaceae bacterium]|nr:hypothetical protein [Gaiellaceae bacterium]
MGTFEQRRFDHHAVEARRIRAAQPGRVRVVRKAENRHLGIAVRDVARIDASDVADNYPDVPILGYTNHTDTAGLRRAHAAGFDQVVAKSALFERTRELIDPLLASVE